MTSDRSGSRQPPGDVTLLIQRASAGDAAAGHELYEEIYGELHRLARAHMAGGESDHTLQPTALVHEAWLRLAKAAPKANGAYRDREHFLLVASRAMRCALVDQARRRGAQKREAGGSRVPLAVVVQLYEDRGIDVLSLDEALERLAEGEPRQSRVVELSFFGGLTHPEIARTIEVSVATVERDWRMARMWLREELREASA